MSASPPRNVTKAMLSAERVICTLAPNEIRQLRGSSFLSISTTKYANEERKLGFGFGVRLPWMKAGHSDNEDMDEMQPGGKHLNLCRLPWCRDMDTWGASEWAWLIILLMHQASDVLPAFRSPATASGEMLSFTFPHCEISSCCHHVNVPLSS